MSIRSFVNRHLFAVGIVIIGLTVIFITSIMVINHQYQESKEKFIQAIYDNNDDYIQKHPNLVNIRDKYGRSAILVAMYAKNFNIFEKLIELKANVNVLDETGVPLIFNTIRQSDGWYFNTLINCKDIDLTITDTQNRDNLPISLVSMNNYNYMMILLAHYNKDNQKIMYQIMDMSFIHHNKKGMNAYDYAKKFGNVKFLKLFEEYENTWNKIDFMRKYSNIGNAISFKILFQRKQNENN